MFITLSFLILGCGKGIDDTLPANPLVFESIDYTNPDNTSDSYMSIMYNGRIFVPFGTLENSINGKDIEACVGYIKNIENPEDTGMRIYTLKESDDFLMNKISDTIMDQPMFYRAVDTKNSNISIPEYIASLDYAFWN